MPHNDNEKPPQVNGEKPSSVFIQHLTSYPVVSDTLQTYASNHYGRRSLDLTHSTYATLSSHLSPYFQTPYSYLSPYLSRADHLGDSTLSTLDNHFPAIKKPTGELVDDGKRIVFAPLRVGHEGRVYLGEVYRGQVKKVGETNGEWAKWPVAAVTASIVVMRDTVGWVQSWLGERAEQGNMKLREGMDKGHSAINGTD